ncbi:PREDICTED: E3 ubiquitin-protein ligase TRIM39-like [Nanorana parkeri]|uniref:E3 ubiquitin-protein ligase TRIM39-like n=1 Tax=Nanorana parkeri TaxID=125878 RepID=UPI0008542C4F|nr:PREDICTED: E3 ubiquitin-protein ligase TRIM39-like [Nanorana parkeri]
MASMEYGLGPAPHTSATAPAHSLAPPPHRTREKEGELDCYTAHAQHLAETRSRSSDLIGQSVYTFYVDLNAENNSESAIVKHKILSVMASFDLREELKCPICWEIYIEPVSLKCGHNFCQDCIIRQLLTQKGSGCYSCPQCKEESEEWPTLHRNIALHNISEHFLSKPSMENRLCFVHNLDLKYYCAQDASCICDKCLEEEHRGHQVESLDEASEKKRVRLKSVHQNLKIEREEMENRVQSLQEHKRKVEGKAAEETDKVAALFRDLRRQLDDLEKKVLKEISINVERISVSVSNLIDQLVIKKGELSRKMRDIDRELSNMMDPLTALQQSGIGDLCDINQRDDEEPPNDGGDLDTTWVSHVIQTGASHITGIMICFHLQEPADISLDINTAHNDLHISDDMKTASYSPHQNRPKTPQRFKDYTQVLSSQSISSGRHYWEVDVGGSAYWSIGMCYPSIDRGGYQAQNECNNKSWCLRRSGDWYSVIRDSKWIELPASISSDRLRVYLDYESGQISFYEFCTPVRHIYTFTATFTEPLHAALRIWNGCVKIYRENRG